MICAHSYAMPRRKLLDRLIQARSRQQPVNDRRRCEQELQSIHRQTFKATLRITEQRLLAEIPDRGLSLSSARLLIVCGIRTGMDSDMAYRHRSWINENVQTYRLVLLSLVLR
jgi:hypothetical protein